MADEPEHTLLQQVKKTPRSVDDLSITEIGNNIMAPLLAGLINSSSGGKSGFASTMKHSLSSKVPLGSPIRLTETFPNGHVMRMRAKPDPDVFVFHDEEEASKLLPTISEFTDGIDKLHRQLLDVGYNMGQLIPPENLPDNLGVETIRKIIDHKDEVTRLVGPENFPVIAMRFMIDGEPTTVEIRNEPVGPLKKPMAQVLMAIGLAGDSVGTRNRPVSNFMFDATGGFVKTLPPVMADAYRKISAQLIEKGYKDPDKILRDSKCDVDRDVIRTAFTQLMAFADVYETASELRGENDSLVTAFRQIRKAMGAGPAQSELECRDAYEYAVLMEGMADYAIAHNPKQNQPELTQLRDEFVNAARQLLPNDTTGIYDRKNPAHDFTPGTDMLIKLPQVDKILMAFREAYAGQYLLDHPMEAADRAWAARVRDLPPGEILR